MSQICPHAPQERFPAVRAKPVGARLASDEVELLPPVLHSCHGLARADPEVVGAVGGWAGALAGSSLGAGRAKKNEAARNRLRADETRSHAAAGACSAPLPGRGSARGTNRWIAWKALVRETRPLPCGRICEGSETACGRRPACSWPGCELQVQQIRLAASATVTACPRSFVALSPDLPEELVSQEGFHSSSEALMRLRWLLFDARRYPRPHLGEQCVL